MPPGVLLTYGDPTLAVSIRNVLQNTSHLLCTYNLSKNLYTNIKPLFKHRDGNAKVCGVGFGGRYANNKTLNLALVWMKSGLIY